MTDFERYARARASLCRWGDELEKFKIAERAAITELKRARWKVGYAKRRLASVRAEISKWRTKTPWSFNVPKNEN